MGYITKQWLKSSTERSSLLPPIEVSMQAHVYQSPETLPSVAKGDVKVVAELYLEKVFLSTDYQNIYFTREDLNKTLPVLMQAVQHDTLTKIAIQILEDLKDSDVVNVLEQVFTARVKKKKRIIG